MKTWLSITALLLCIGCAPQKESGSARASNDHLIVSNLDVAASGRHYKVDRALNLKVYYSYRVHGSVQYRLVDQSGGEQESPKNGLTGKYKLTVAALPQSDTDSGAPSEFFYSADSVVANVRDGILDAEITLPFEYTEHPLLTSRTQLLLQLEPKSADLPAGASFVTVFDPLADSSRLSLRVAETSVSDQVATYLSTNHIDGRLEADGSTTHAKTSPIGPGSSHSLFAQKAQLQSFDTASLSGLKFSEADFGLIIKTLRGGGKLPFDRAQRFCWWIYKAGQDLESCLKNPEAALRFAPTKHMESVDSKTRVVKADSAYFQISTSEFSETSDSREVADGTRGTLFIFNLTSLTFKDEVGVTERAGLEAGGNGVSAFNTSSMSVANETGVRVGHEWYHVDQTINKDITGVRTSETLNRNIQVKSIALRFDGLVSNCLIIVGSLKNRIRGVHLCPSRPSEESVTEDWYFITQTPLNTGGGSGSGRDSFDERLLSAAMRGRHNFQQISNILRQKSEHTIPLLIKLNTPKVGGGALPDYSDGNFPGLLSN